MYIYIYSEKSVSKNRFVEGACRKDRVFEGPCWKKRLFEVDVKNIVFSRFQLKNQQQNARKRYQVGNGGRVVVVGILG